MVRKINPDELPPYMREMVESNNKFIDGLNSSTSTSSSNISTRARKIEIEIKNPKVLVELIPRVVQFPSEFNSFVRPSVVYHDDNIRIISNQPVIVSSSFCHPSILGFQPGFVVLR